MGSTSRRTAYEVDGPTRVTESHAVAASIISDAFSPIMMHAALCCFVAEIEVARRIPR